jgi:hypothetical protein
MQNWQEQHGRRIWEIDARRANCFHKRGGDQLAEKKSFARNSFLVRKETITHKTDIAVVVCISEAE